MFASLGNWLNWLERLLRKQEVIVSTPTFSTKALFALSKKGFLVFTPFFGT
jgi:hypothetical protein